MVCLTKSKNDWIGECIANDFVLIFFAWRHTKTFALNNIKLIKLKWKRKHWQRNSNSNNKKKTIFIHRRYGPKTKKSESKCKWNISIKFFRGITKIIIFPLLLVNCQWCESHIHPVAFYSGAAVASDLKNQLLIYSLKSELWSRQLWIDFPICTLHTATSNGTVLNYKKNVINFCYEIHENGNSTFSIKFSTFLSSSTYPTGPFASEHNKFSYLLSAVNCRFSLHCDRSKCISVHFHDIL